MIYLIGGESHTGKTAFAQQLVRHTGSFCVSIDHLKMGLIRAGYTQLTPMSREEKLTEYLWPVVSEMAKTAIENKQNLIIEGCYIPATWRDSFAGEGDYLNHIRTLFLVMDEDYIYEHFDSIVAHANDSEDRGEHDGWLSADILARGNNARRAKLEEASERYLLIQSQYPSFEDMLAYVEG